MSLDQRFLIRVFMLGFNLTIDPGERLGVTGPSGCGKSSLGLLLTKLYALNGGRILLDGYDVNELDSTFLRTTVRVCMCIV